VEEIAKFRKVSDPLRQFRNFTAWDTEITGSQSYIIVPINVGMHAQRNIEERRDAPLDADAAGQRFVESGHDSQQGRLACTVVPYQGEPIALSQFCAYAV
jgi:hypothetical protein